LIGYLRKKNKKSLAERETRLAKAGTRARGISLSSCFGNGSPHESPSLSLCPHRRADFPFMCPTTQKEKSTTLYTIRGRGNEFLRRSFFLCVILGGKGRNESGKTIPHVLYVSRAADVLVRSSELGKEKKGSKNRWSLFSSGALLNVLALTRS